MTARRILCPGTRAAEAALLTDLAALQDEARHDPRLLARPVRVVVPSRSLRLHLASRLVAARGRGVAGICIETHFAAALEVLAALGARPLPTGGHLLSLLAARAAATHGELAPLGELADGYSAVAATVRDLLDAGYEDALEEGLRDALAGLPAARRSPAQAARTAALLRVAGTVRSALEALGAAPPSRILEDATAAVHTRGPTVLPARAVLLYGYADATGRVADFLEALLRLPGARLYWDRPPDPAAPGVPGGGFTGFGERLFERLTAGAPVEDRPPPPPPQLTVLQAPGSDGEAAAVAWRVAELLAAGTRPEAVGVVARDLGPYRRPLRRAFGARGIPFSGIGEGGSLSPTGRFLHGLAELLGRRGELPTSRFLALLAPPSRPTTAGELALAFAALGAGRLDQAAELDPAAVAPRGHLPLPLVAGLTTEDEEAPRPTRRVLPREPLAKAVAAARAVRDGLRSWPSPAPVERWGELLRQLVGGALGRGTGSTPMAAVELLTRRLGQEVPATFPLTWRELAELVAELVPDLAAGPLGGQGGGVPVLSVTEARGRTFDHLFVLGLERDRFPRPIREDPLLPDGLRGALQVVLPDLPVKSAGHGEERYLFAQLLSAAPVVILSYPGTGDDGRPRSPSPLLQALAPPPAGSPDPSPGLAPRLAREAALEVARSAPAAERRERFLALLPAAVAESRAVAGELLGAARGATGVAEGRLATARGRILAELAPDLATSEGRATATRPGPFLGFVTPAAAPHSLPVTTLEALAGCPWQLFLIRRLGLEPPPDPLALPALEPRLWGLTVHRVLAELTERASQRTGRPLAATVDEALLQEPFPLEAPGEAELAAALLEAARETLAEEGLAATGLAPALAAAARPFLAPEAPAAALAAPAVLAAEVRGTVELTAGLAGGPPGGDGASRSVTFRADRLEVTPAGPLLTDFKTGRPFITVVREDARRRHLLRAVRSGERLQGVAYARALGPGGAGRYLFLQPGEAPREERLAADDGELMAAFETTAAALLTGWEAGVFFPRLVTPAADQEPRRCSFCPVAEACLRGDSGARRRLVQMVRQEAVEPSLAALRTLFQLPAGDAEEP
jgi:hypothetical protein